MLTPARLIIFTIIACGLIFTTASHRAPQVTWYVDDDAPSDPGPGDPSVSDPLEDGSSAHPFDTIQEGINAAIAGDTVLVRDGTYTGTGNKNLDFSGRAITVRSETGPAQAVIDCEGTGCGFYFHSDETTASRVEGFTVTRGSGFYESPYDRGGGVYCWSSSPAIADCIFSNHVTDYGGGVYCRESDAEITGCTFTENQALLGGGICLFLAGLDDPASARVDHCTFLNNEAQWHGGAVRVGMSYSLQMKIASAAVSEAQAVIPNSGAASSNTIHPGPTAAA